MKGIRTIANTSTNQILISIPDELKNTDLEIIILPATGKSNPEIEFWTDEELIALSKKHLSKPLDNDDYSKW